MEDDLEYYITFPTPTPKETYQPHSSRDDDDDFVFVNGVNGEKEPVVFVLGWLGARDELLSKYCNIYNQRGCITIRYTSPASYLFVRPNVKLLIIARKLLALLKDMSLDSHPVFFHIMSNNGSTLYYYISEAISELKPPAINVKGCIFDSTPAPRRIYSAAHAIYQVTPGSMWMKLCASLGMVIYLMGCGMLSILWTIISGKLPKHPPWALVEERTRCPQLFLYSKSDDLIKSEDVEFFIAERQKLGVPVSTKCWPNSPHVQHYRHYPEEYSSTIYNFLSTCINKDVMPEEESADDSTNREADKPKAD